MHCPRPTDRAWPSHLCPVRRWTDVLALVFVECRPDPIISHATDQCHDKHACGRREQLRNPDRHREVEAEERDLGGVFVDEDNDQQDE